MLKLTTQLAAVNLTSDPLTLKLVHGVLVSQVPFLPSLVFVGLFVFPLGGGTGQTDRRTGSTHDGASFYEGRPIIIFLNTKSVPALFGLAHWPNTFFTSHMQDMPLPCNFQNQVFCTWAMAYEM